VIVDANAALVLTRKGANEVGCIAYLPKPFPMKMLIDAIEAVVGAPESMN
jgi:hypothetical protein